MRGLCTYAATSMIHKNTCCKMYDHTSSHLGLVLLSGKKLNVDSLSVRRKFFISVNCILSQCSQTFDLDKLYLCEWRCLPNLMYTSESLYLTTKLNSTNSLWHSNSAS